MQSDAAEMAAAREKAAVIHHTRYIDAAGDEVEKAVRRVICLKFPTTCYVEHGHIVEFQLAASPQFDVVIADNSARPVLFMAENGTEYFSYESIYASESFTLHLHIISGLVYLSHPTYYSI